MALYHKHRPQIFADVIGQEHIIKTITNQIKNNNLAHAYIFSGARGLGKTTTARLLAKAANCKKRAEGAFEPCDNCPSCAEISRSSSIDVIEIDAASQTGVENVRENIIENARFRPTSARYKIFIIDEAHMLSTPALNALLKILEEPPEYVIFVLATTELSKLPETVISRCQRFNFKKIPFDILKKHLEKIAKEEKIKLDKTVIERIINKSDNCARDAVSLLDMLLSTGEQNITDEIAEVALPTSNADEIIDFFGFLVTKNATQALQKINNLSDEGVNLAQFAQDLLSVLRWLMVKKAGADIAEAEFDLGHEAEKKIVKLGKELTSSQVVALIDLILRRKSEIKSSPISQLPIELAIVEWCGQNDNYKRVEQNPDENPVNDQEAGERKEKEDKKSIKEKVRELVHKENHFTLKDVQDKWNEFLEKMENCSTALAFIIKSANLSGVDGHSIQLTVGFSFHKDKLLEKTVAKKIEDLLEEIMGGRMRLDVKVDANTENTKTIDNELQDLVAAFGGEVVN